MKLRLLQTYVGPLTTELDENRTKQAELNREIRKALEAAKRHEHDASFTRHEESCVQTVHERGQLVGVVAESLTWDKMSEVKDTPILPREELDALQSAAKSLRGAAAEKQKGA